MTVSSARVKFGERFVTAYLGGSARTNHATLAKRGRDMAAKVWNGEEVYLALRRRIQREEDAVLDCERKRNGFENHSWGQIAAFHHLMSMDYLWSEEDFRDRITELRGNPRVGVLDVKKRDGAFDEAWEIGLDEAERDLL